MHDRIYLRAKLSDTNDAFEGGYEFLQKFIRKFRRRVQKGHFLVAVFQKLHC